MNTIVSDTSARERIAEIVARQLERMDSTSLSTAYLTAEATDEILASLPSIEGEWLPIETAPKDGKRFLALHRSPHRGESRIETVWWQPEFEAFITRCHEMTMAPGYLIDGETRKLHSPDIFPATHWLCVIPDLPAMLSATPSSDGERR